MTAPAGLPETLRRFRLRAGLSLCALQRASGIHYSYLSRVESGTRTPTRAALGRIADGLGLDADDRATLLRSAGYVESGDDAAEAFRAAVHALCSTWQPLDDEWVMVRRSAFIPVAGAVFSVHEEAA